MKLGDDGIYFLFDKGSSVINDLRKWLSSKRLMTTQKKLPFRPEELADVRASLFGYL